MLEGCGLIIRFRVHNGYDIPSPARKIVKSMRGVGSPPGTGDGRTLYLSKRHVSWERANQGRGEGADRIGG